MITKKIQNSHIITQKLNIYLTLTYIFQFLTKT